MNGGCCECASYTRRVRLGKPDIDDRKIQKPLVREISGKKKEKKRQIIALRLWQMVP